MEMPIEVGSCVARECMKPVMGFHPYGWVFQVLILVLVGGIIYWVLKGGQGGAIEIVKKRYAKGEISRAEFLKLKKELE